MFCCHSHHHFHHYESSSVKYPTGLRWPRHGTGKGMAFVAEKNLVIAWNTFRGSVWANPNPSRKTWKGTSFTGITMVAAFWIHALASRTLMRNILTWLAVS
jgi:hypothetical protein